MGSGKFLISLTLCHWLQSSSAYIMAQKVGVLVELAFIDKGLKLIYIFGLVTSSLSLCLSQSFGHCMLWPSSGGWNVELNPLFRSPG